MLEDGSSLLTWKLEKPPIANLEITAFHIGNHRLAYLDYEGPVSGGRGTVTRWDAGEFEWIERNDDRISVSIHGRILKANAIWAISQRTWSFHKVSD